MLKLASGYLGIPTSNMNELLEKLISEFGIIRENVLVDYTPGTKSKPKPIERLSPEEYKELLHEDHFKVPCKYSELDYGDGEIDYVPCEYTTYYYRTLAVKDPEFHDWVICTVSRIYWLRYSQMLNFCQCNGYSLFADVIENKLKLSLNLLLKRAFSRRIIPTTFIGIRQGAAKRGCPVLLFSHFTKIFHIVY